MILLCSFILLFLWVHNHSTYPSQNSSPHSPSSQDYHITEITLTNPHLRTCYVAFWATTLHLICLFTFSSMFVAHGLFLFVTFFSLIWRSRLISLLLSWGKYLYNRIIIEKYTPLCYHAGIEITTLPLILKESRKDQFQFSRTTTTTGKPIYFNAERPESWLNAVATSNIGVELSKSNGLRWKIFTVISSQKGAEVQSRALKQLYRAQFPGLECHSFTRAISLRDFQRIHNPLSLLPGSSQHISAQYPKDYEKYSPSYELHFPASPFPQKLPLIQSLVSLLNSLDLPLTIQLSFSAISSPHKYPILSRIRKSSCDRTMKRELEPLWIGHVYRMRLGFFLHSIDPSPPNYDHISSLDTLVSFHAHLQTLIPLFQNLKAQPATLKIPSLKDLFDLYTLSLHKGVSVTPYCFDSDFSQSFLKRAHKLPQESLSPQYDRSEDPAYLDLGLVYQQGSQTHMHAYLPLHVLTMNTLIAGTPGVGKSVLISNLISQLTWQSPQTGILIINTSKRGEDRQYPDFTVYQYGAQSPSAQYSDISSLSSVSLPSLISPNPGLSSSALPILGSNSNESVALTSNTLHDPIILPQGSPHPSISSFSRVFSLPYAIIAEDIPINTLLKQISRNLAAVTGLMDFAYRYFYTPLTRYYAKYHSLPVDLSLVFALALRYLHQNPYAPKEQQNLHQAISMRGREFLEDPTFCKTIAFRNTLPLWLEGFLIHGQKIFLDLTACDTITQQFLILTLLQHIDTLTKNRNFLQSETLQNLLVFDEAHCIFAKPQDIDMKSDENIRQGAINKAIIPYLLEFRSRRVGCMIADQSPSKLMASLGDQTAIKLLFRLGGECAKMYSTTPDLQEFIMHQPQYHCVVMDGTRGELYQICTHPKEKG